MNGTNQPKLIWSQTVSHECRLNSNHETFCGKLTPGISHCCHTEPSKSWRWQHIAFNLFLTYSWSYWSTCSSTIRTGFRIRNRMCPKEQCPGDDVQIIKCNEKGKLALNVERLNNISCRCNRYPYTLTILQTAWRHRKPKLELLFIWIVEWYNSYTFRSCIYIWNWIGFDLRNYLYVSLVKRQQQNWVTPCNIY